LATNVLAWNREEVELSTTVTATVSSNPNESHGMLESMSLELDNCLGAELSTTVPTTVSCNSNELHGMLVSMSLELVTGS
jgi:hypothetical protein